MLAQSIYQPRKLTLAVACKENVQVMVIRTRIAPAVGIALLLASALAFNVQPVKAILWTEPIYIRADGSIEPSDAPIITFDSVTYTLAGNIASSGDGIIVERDNITLNGADYTIQGTGAFSSKGIDLSGRTNVTIRQINSKHFYYGIWLSSSSNSSIYGNNITNNGQGIWLFGSSDNSISLNTIANNELGIGLYDVYVNGSPNFSNHNSVNGNTVTNNNVGIKLDSNYNSVVGNNVTINNFTGVWLGNSFFNNVSRNTIENNMHGIHLFKSSDNNVSENVFVDDGLYVLHSYGNIVVDNLVNGKPLVYLEGVSDLAVENAGQVILVNCTRITVENLNLSHTAVGVQLFGTSNTTIAGNTVTNNWSGIELFESSDNSISLNTITNNWGGIGLWRSSDNCIRGNTIANNSRGIDLYESSNNRLCHNNLLDNTQQVRDASWDDPFVSASINDWDDGPTSGGNYWSDYEARYPEAEELDGSGIWDTPYVIDADNQDNYPLMYPYSSTTYALTIFATVGGTTTPSPGTHTYVNGTVVEVTAIPKLGYSFDYWLLNGEERTENPITVIMNANYTLEAIFVEAIPPEIVFDVTWEEETYPVAVTSNSTISDFNFSQPLKQISFNVTGTGGSTGFCNVTIPKALLWAENGWTITVGDQQITDYTLTTDGNYTHLYFTYTHSTQTVVIEGTHVIPEFPSALILTLFMCLSAIAFVFAKKKHPKKTQTPFF